jgi:hypothetical protein
VAIPAKKERTFGRRGVLARPGGLGTFGWDNVGRWTTRNSTRGNHHPRTRILPRRDLQRFSARQADSDARRLNGVGPRTNPILPAGVGPRTNPILPATACRRGDLGTRVGPKATSPTTVSRLGTAPSHPWRAATHKCRNPTASGSRVEGSLQRLGRCTRIMPRLPKGPT